MHPKSTESNPPRMVISKILNFWINMTLFQLIVSGICPITWKPKNSSSRMWTAVSYLWVYTFTVLKAVRLIAIVAPLSYYSLTGTLNNFIETAGLRLPDAVTFLCAILIAARWSEIKRTIFKIRSYEAEYFAKRELWLALTLTTALLAILSICCYQTSTSLQIAFHVFVKTEAEFYATNYGINIFQTSTLVQIVYLTMYLLNLLSIYITAVLFFIISLVAGRLCFRIKQCLSLKGEPVLDRTLRDHLTICNWINKLSEQIGSFLMLFYTELVLYILALINGFADKGLGMSPAKQLQSGMTVMFMTVILTLAMIYTCEQANISQEIQDLADQATDHEKRMYYHGYLHRVTYKPTGFSLAGIVQVGRPFVATIIGVFFTYGTFVLQLKESRHENGSSAATTMDASVRNLTYTP